MGQSSNRKGVVSMEQLIIRQPLKLFTVPEILVADFEAMVLDSYFGGGIHDLIHLGHDVDHFAVLALSLEETGNAFTYWDDEEWISENSGDVIANDYYDIVQDVGEVLDYHHIFFAWDDKGDGGYEFIGDFYNLPNVEVW
jgi:hypothetical protein